MNCFGRKRSTKTNIQFMGPAQMKFSSLNEQADYYLNTYWPNWNNYAEPQSYILPPVFKYKHPEVSDEAFEKAHAGRKKDCLGAITSDRISDQAEHDVYNAIEQLIEDKVQAPFIALHNLDLHLNFNGKIRKQIHGSLTKIFPDLPWDYFQKLMSPAFSKERPNAEYDFVLLGPKIGIVFIEVKSSSYKQKNHFKSQNKLLPNDYEKGLNQLHSTRALIYLLQMCSGVSFPIESSVRKILFTPNLKKVRFLAWSQSLSTTDQARLKSKVGNVIQWFKQEDIEGSDKGLVCKMKSLLQSDIEIEPKIFEAYCPILASIASITLLKRDDVSTVEMEKLNFSKLDAAIQESSQIIHQNPLKNQSSKLASCSALKRAPKEIKNYFNIILLTPDQQKAMRGPCRQIILGAAGTGKTVVLQAKAIECLRKGQSVAVLAQASYCHRYEKLFDKCGFKSKNYRIYDWDKESFIVYKKVSKPEYERVISEPHHLLLYVEKHLERLAQGNRGSIRRYFSLFWRYQNVFIDDSLDKTGFCRGLGPPILPIFIIMALARKEWPSKVVWAAADPYTRIEHPKYSNVYDQSIRLLSGSWNDSAKCLDYFYPTVLKYVMRCSEHVFRSVYDNAKVNFLPEFEPLLGHKIQGLKVQTIRKHFSALPEAKAAAWVEVKTVITRFIRQDVDLRNVAVIVAAGSKSSEITIQHRDLRDFLLKKCSLEFSELHSKTCSMLRMETWNEISSLEWPAIIYISCTPTRWQDKYAKYRAISRATAILIDISLTYGK